MHGVSASALVHLPREGGPSEPGLVYVVNESYAYWQVAEALNPPRIDLHEFDMSIAVLSDMGEFEYLDDLPTFVSAARSVRRPA